MIIFGLPREVDEEEIHALCLALGPNNPAIARHPTTLSSLGFAFVTWQSAWDAALAAERLNRHRIRPDTAITCKIYVADAHRSRSNEPLMRDLSAQSWVPRALSLATPSDVGQLHQSAALLASRPRVRSFAARISHQASARDEMEANAMLHFFVASLAPLHLGGLSDAAVRATLLDHGVGSADDRDRVLVAVRAAAAAPQVCSSQGGGAEVVPPASATSNAAAADRAAAHSAFLPSWLDLCFGRRGTSGLPHPFPPPAVETAALAVPGFASALVRRSSSRVSRQTSAASSAVQTADEVSWLLVLYVRVADVCVVRILLTV